MSLLFVVQCKGVVSPVLASNALSSNINIYKYIYINIIFNDQFEVSMRRVQEKADGRR